MYIYIYEILIYSSDMFEELILKAKTNKIWYIKISIKNYLLNYYK